MSIHFFVWHSKHWLHMLSSKRFFFVRRTTTCSYLRITDISKELLGSFKARIGEIILDPDSSTSPLRSQSDKPDKHT